MPTYELHLRLGETDAWRRVAGKMADVTAIKAAVARLIDDHVADPMGSMSIRVKRALDPWERK